MNKNESDEIKKAPEEIYETCIICNSLTDVKKEEHIDNRHNYIEESGQLCEQCY